jgi:hypothetical protein
VATPRLRSSTSCMAARRRLTRRLQLAGGKPKEEIHLCGSGLGPAAEAQAVRQQGNNAPIG